MRKVLALLMLVILPLQFAWAGAAIYCQHETSQSVQHFGHHVHGDQAASSDEAKSNGDASSNGADCSYHLPAAKCGFDVLAPADPALSEVRNASPPSSFTSFIPDGLERPDRQAAAFSASGEPARS